MKQGVPQASSRAQWCDHAELRNAGGVSRLRGCRSLRHGLRRATSLFPSGKRRLLDRATSYGCATIQKAPLGSKGAHENNRRGRFFSFHLPPTVERRFAICPRRSFPCLAAFHGCTKWEFTSLCACGALPLILSFPVQALRSYNSMPFFYLYIRPLPHAGFFSDAIQWL